MNTQNNAETKTCAWYALVGILFVCAAVIGVVAWSALSEALAPLAVLADFAQ
jgi:hypothetical protein